MKQDFNCVLIFFVFILKRHLKVKNTYDFITYVTLIHYIQNWKQDVATWRSKLRFEIDPIVVFQVWIIKKPVPPFPKRGRHFIQKLGLCFAAEHMLPQALSSGSILLPQFLLVASLASDPKATMQPHEPVRHRFNSLPLALLQTDIRQTSAWLLSQTENEWRYPL